MIIFLFGSDNLAKDSKISEIKKKYIATADSENFDFETLYSDKLNSDDLKKALVALPAVSKKRLVVLRGIQKLSKHSKEIIVEFSQKDESATVLVLESDTTKENDSFLVALGKKCEAIRFGKEQKQNVFDMTREMSRDPAEALKILSEIIEEGTHPLQIMGGLVWFWGRLRNQLPASKFQKGLEELQDADLNIKRSRCNAEHAVEILIVKLMGIMNPRFQLEK